MMSWWDCAAAEFIVDYHSPPGPTSAWKRPRRGIDQEITCAAGRAIAGALNLMIEEARAAGEEAAGDDQPSA